MSLGSNLEYSVIVCPKCGKRHFKVKAPAFDIVPAIFNTPEEPEYKDGVRLFNQREQNAKTIKERFQCLECGCNFRVEYLPGKAYKYIDEDKEEADTIKLWQKRWQKQDKKAEAQRKKQEAKKKAEDDAWFKKHPGGYGIASVDNNNLLISGTTTDTKVEFMFGNGDKSIIDLGGVKLHSNKTFTEEQITNIKEQFGFEVTNND